MTARSIQIENIKGISQSDVSALQEKFGKNIFRLEPARNLLHILKDVAIEPMFILLFIATCLYFFLGQPDEGIMMIVAMVFVGGISVYQETKSSQALKALRKYTEPKIVVVRDGRETTIDSVDLVPGDVMLLSEGNKVPADAAILKQNDLTINESIISGESFAVVKTDGDDNFLYQGTTINSGQCYAQVVATASHTVLGKMGRVISSYHAPRTLLQMQMGRFLKQFSLFGFVAFVIILLLNYLNSHNAISSLLYALTLAMAVIPEEIPVAFSSFMALGAFHMARLGLISRQPQIVENLGAISVICLDKTGTITKNDMEVRTIYDYGTDTLVDLEKINTLQSKVLRYASLASEMNPFDSMEKAIRKAYEEHVNEEATQDLKMIYEYPLQGHPPMMTHVYEGNNKKIIAAKGGAEIILNVCRLPVDDRIKVETRIKLLAQKGFRVLGVASAHLDEEPLPSRQSDFDWRFEGLLSLYDPPKKDIASVFKRFYDAKINVKLITGDFPETAINIAESVGMFGYLKFYTGEQIMNMTDDELQEAVHSVNVFARMFPDSKLRVIEALKTSGEIVAMTGDGVNDAPALKSAHIGIAMGKNGTEIARQAADLIITNDDLNKIADAIEQGRKIFNNLKKAIRYIISIHIPIILTASLPLLLGWKYPNIFTPIHIIFLELIMGPTCSVFYEREPVEKDIMFRYPRNRKQGLFRTDEVILSMIQGLLIAAGVLTLYNIYMYNGHSLEETRTIVFTTLIISNIFLTFVNRSFSKTLIATNRYKNNLALPVLILSIVFLSSFLLIPFIRNLFELSFISPRDFSTCLITAFVTTGWFEIYKAARFGAS